MAKKITRWMFLLVLPLGLLAQQDTLSVMREFVKVCQTYKQLPLQLTINMKSSANVLTTREDTVQLEAAFYMNEHGSYTRMGELEQVVNDSLLLLVSHQAHQMLLYANHHSASSQLQSYLGFQLKDSSVIGLAHKFRAVMGSHEGNISRLEIASRGLLTGSSLPHESIEVVYRADSYMPEKITQVTRTLVPTDSSNCVRLLNSTEWAGKLVTLPGQGWFLVKELSTVFEYVSIGHQKDLPIPVRISDRVIASSPGVYAPVGQYKNFILNQSLEEGGR